MYMSYNRYEKLEWLRQTCSEEFKTVTLLDEMVRWMGEADFEEFYDKLCRNWEIEREPNDPKFSGKDDEV
jgi:hypothetical protein